DRAPGGSGTRQDRHAAERQKPRLTRFSTLLRSPRRPVSHVASINHFAVVAALRPRYKLAARGETRRSQCRSRDVAGEREEVSSVGQEWPSSREKRAPWPQRLSRSEE